MEIYPNPFQNRIRVKNQNAAAVYSLLNAMGQVIWTGNDVDKQDFGCLPAGVYFLKVKEPVSSAVYKLMKN